MDANLDEIRRFRPVRYIGRVNYVVDVHWLSDQMLACCLKASLEGAERLVELLQDSGGLLAIEHGQRGSAPDLLPEVLYHAKAVCDDERVIKLGGMENEDELAALLSELPCIQMGNLLQAIKNNVAKAITTNEVDWLRNQFAIGLQDLNVRAHSYNTRDMRK